MGEKSFLPTSTPRWHHAEGAFLGGLPCIGIIEIPIHRGAAGQHFGDGLDFDVAQAALLEEVCPALIGGEEVFEWSRCV
ncbi:hypothetical protein NLO93_28510, partial [Pseudomonas savastanoi]